MVRVWGHTIGVISGSGSRGSCHRPDCTEKAEYVVSFLRGSWNDHARMNRKACARHGWMFADFWGLQLPVQIAKGGAA